MTPYDAAAVLFVLAFALIVFVIGPKTRDPQ